MKSMKKFGVSLAFSIIAGLLPIVIMLAIIMGILGSVGSDVKNTLTVSVESQERFDELMQVANLGVPSDIIMMITTLQCETEEEAQAKPFIDSVLEFLVMTEVISEKHHTCDMYTEDGRYTGDEFAECYCEFKVVDTNFYYYKDELLGYLSSAGIDEPLDVWNIERCLQAAADRKAAERDYEAIIKVQVNAIDNTLYEDAIRRCGIEDRSIIKAIIDLHESGYYIEWFKQRAAEFGTELSEGILTGGVNGVHARIMAAIAGDTSPFVGESFGDPVSGWRGIVSCEFGGYVGHTGIDFAAPIGTPVYASISGKVIITGSGSTGYGNYVVINHGGGIATLYAHNKQVLVSAGQTVTQGQVIAYSGNTGNVRPRPTPENPTAGAHLHFEVVVNGTPKNPRGYLS